MRRRGKCTQNYMRATRSDFSLISSMELYSAKTQLTLVGNSCGNANISGIIPHEKANGALPARCFFLGEVTKRDQPQFKNIKKKRSYLSAYSIRTNVIPPRFGFEDNPLLRSSIAPTLYDCPCMTICDRKYEPITKACSLTERLTKS